MSPLAQRKGCQMASRNALTDAALGGLKPSLDDEIKRLVQLYGKAAVRNAVSRLPKNKAGRKQENDLAHLKDWFEQDAQDWLNGLDPAKARSNYQMAMHVASLAKPHYYAATLRRVQRKLAKRRHFIGLVMAWQSAEATRPYADYFRAGDAIIAHDDKFGDMVQSIADNARGKIERYKARYGDPDPCMTLAAIDEALNAPMVPDIVDRRARRTPLWG